MKDLVDLLQAASYYQFDIEFDGKGMFRVILPDESASTWSSSSTLSLVEAIAFVVANSRKKPE